MTRKTEALDHTRPMSHHFSQKNIDDARRRIARAKFPRHQQGGRATRHKVSSNEPLTSSEALAAAIYVCLAIATACALSMVAWRVFA